MADAVRFDAVVKRYGARAVVDGVDFGIAEGEFFALLGANGAGKTTLISMLAWLARPSAGSVRVLGHDVDAQHPDGAGAGPRKAGQHADQRRLAGAVGTEQAEELALLDLERDLVDRAQPGLALGALLA